jgi:regulator of RNase E activity RraA
MDGEVLRTLERVSTGTITTILLKKGIRRTFMRGPRSLPGTAGKRVVGAAFTLRFVPAREDLATPQSWSSPQSTRAAIEAMPPGAVAVVDAMGITDCGVFGDILCARMRQRQVAALVTDGAVRDLVGVEQVGLPVWCRGAAAPPSIAHLLFVNWQEPIGCGGVAVIPGDIIVADGDGVVVIPVALAEAVATAGLEQERLEGWILTEVERGVKLPGLYPADAATMARYEAESKHK